MLNEFKNQHFKLEIYRQSQYFSIKQQNIKETVLSSCSSTQFPQPFVGSRSILCKLDYINTMITGIKMYTVT
jgi:hypothetical protein